MNGLKDFNIEFRNYFNNYYAAIFNEFVSWLLSIEEDTPLPHEIKYFQFMIMRNNNIFNISVSGHELKPKRVNSGMYTPLEAQYFYNKELISIHFIGESEQDRKRFILFVLNNLVLDFLKQQESGYLKNKKIVIGFAFEKPIIVT